MSLQEVNAPPPPCHPAVAACLGIKPYRTPQISVASYVTLPRSRRIGEAIPLYRTCRIDLESAHPPSTENKQLEAHTEMRPRPLPPPPSSSSTSPPQQSRTPEICVQFAQPQDRCKCLRPSSVAKPSHASPVAAAPPLPYRRDGGGGGGGGWCVKKSSAVVSKSNSL